MKRSNGGLTLAKSKPKPRTQRRTQTKEHTVKEANGKISDNDILAWLKTQDDQVISTQLRDGLGFQSRTQARRVLRRLAKAKKVKVESRKLSDKRSVLTFRLA